MMAAISVFSHRLPESSFDETRNRESAARSAGQTAIVAAHGFMEAYDPQAAEHFMRARPTRDQNSRALRGGTRRFGRRVAGWPAIGKWRRRHPIASHAALWLTPPPRYVLDDWRNLSRVCSDATMNTGVFGLTGTRRGLPAASASRKETKSPVFACLTMSGPRSGDCQRQHF